ncbi:MAG: NADH-quinone oxidoreductase subunit M [Roseovarius sp.]|nr:NADH-quinone oxidoreductase subunit M [Roseovarius sp.]
MDMTNLFAMEQIGFPVLSLALWAPALAALALWTGRAGVVVRQFALAAAAVQVLATFAIALSFESAHDGLQMVESLGLYRLGIDGVSVLFLPLTAILTLLCLLASGPRDWRGAQEGVPQDSDERHYYAALLALSAGLTGAFIAADIRLFWVFLSLEGVPAWYLLHRFGHCGRSRNGVARDFAVIMAMAAGLSLIGLELLIGHLGGAGLELLAQASMPASAQTVIFVLLALAFAIRAPLFPLHGWLPRVLDNGPIMGLGVFLVGLKIGTYGFLRFVIAPLPEAAAAHGWVLVALGGIGAIYGGVMALVQTDLRRLLAFASIAHMGVIVIGLFSLNAHGIEGGLLQMLSIGMAMAGLYILGAFIATRVPRPDISHMGALVSRAPWLAGTFLLIALAAVGMPGTSGFNGEHLVVIGAYEAHWSFAFFVGASTVLTAAYLLRFFQRAFMNPAQAEAKDHAFDDLTGIERAIAGSLTAMVLIVGLYTGPFIDLTRASVTIIVERVPQVPHAPAMAGRAFDHASIATTETDN